MNKNKPNGWLKSKGYLHITPQINIFRDAQKILAKVKNTDYISNHAFYPLIHSIIQERKYKKIDKSGKRAHSHLDKNGNPKKTVKQRPLHYATHFDSIVFGYYAEQLQNRYEEKLKSIPELNSAIIAYRQIPIDNHIDSKGKGTIHFAHEVFETVKEKCQLEGECIVLAFDIKSFFSRLDHTHLEKAWADLLNVDKLPKDHYNVFKGATKFSYILKDDLRVSRNQKGKKSGFDEKQLANIRNTHGRFSYFESNKAFREAIKSGKIKVYTKPFWNRKTGKPIGIPQGLPISAILANLYLLDFDLKIVEFLVKNLGGYYRRYSDDIVVICNNDQKEIIEKYITESITESGLEISKDKTEKFHFKYNKDEKGETILQCISLTRNNLSPFVYLGFEFNGKHPLIKSTNLAKFYRRLIYSVKRKANRALKVAKQSPEGSQPAIYRKQLKRLYTLLDLDKVTINIKSKKLVKNDFGTYTLVTSSDKANLKSNYISYVKRAAEIMNEPKILDQIGKHEKIFNDAVNKHIENVRTKL